MKQSPFLILFFLFLMTVGRGQTFSVDSSVHYYKTYQEARLADYLSRTQNRVPRSMKAQYHYYTAQSARLEGQLGTCLEHVIAGKKLAHDRLDTMRIKFLELEALLYRQRANPTKALSLLEEVIAVKKLNGADNDALAFSYIGKANTFLNFSYKDATYSTDSILYYYRLARKLTKSEALRTSILANIASINLKNDQLDSVEQNFLQVLDYYEKTDNKRKIVGVRLSLASYYADRGLNEQAMDMLDELAVLLHARDEWKTEKKLYYEIRTYNNEWQGMWAAVACWQDSMLLIEKSLSATRLDDQYEKYELQSMYKEKETELYRNRFVQSVLLGTSGTLLLALFGLFKYLGLKRRNAEEALSNYKITASLETTKARMEGEQKERESIASVLHDQVASLLTAADMHIRVARKTGAHGHKLQKAEDIINDVHAQVRDLSHQLVSPTLTKYGLGPGLESLTDRMNADKLKISYDSEVGGLRYAAQLETFLFQCCSELIHNVVKHSTATRCQVYLTQDDAVLQLSVSDNGEETSRNEASTPGLGHVQISRRAKALGGEFSFIKQGSGARAMLQVPAVPLAEYQ